MSLVDIAKKYYCEQMKNCPVSTFLAANEYFELGLSEADAALVTGFGGGIGCGKICGTAAASVAILGKLFSDRENLKEICAAFISEYEEYLGCGSIDCAIIASKNKTADNRCNETVIKTAELLEKFVAKHR